MRRQRIRRRLRCTLSSASAWLGFESKLGWGLGPRLGLEPGPGLGLGLGLDLFW